MDRWILHSKGVRGSWNQDSGHRGHPNSQGQSCELHAMLSELQVCWHIYVDTAISLEIHDTYTRYVCTHVRNYVGRYVCMYAWVHPNSSGRFVSSRHKQRPLGFPSLKPGCRCPRMPTWFLGKHKSMVHWKYVDLLRGKEPMLNIQCIVLLWLINSMCICFTHLKFYCIPYIHISCCFFVSIHLKTGKQQRVQNIQHSWHVYTWNARVHA